MPPVDSQQDIRSAICLALEQMGVAPEHFLSVHQVHSPDAVIATGPWSGETRPRADAIVTRTEGIADPKQ